MNRTRAYNPLYIVYMRRWELCTDNQVQIHTVKGKRFMKIIGDGYHEYGLRIVLKIFRQTLIVIVRNLLRLAWRNQPALLGTIFHTFGLKPFSDRNSRNLVVREPLSIDEISAHFVQGKVSSFGIYGIYWDSPDFFGILLSQLFRISCFLLNPSNLLFCDA